MASLQGVQYRQIVAKGKVGQVADDLSAAIKIIPLAGAGTSPTVVVTTATHIALNAVLYTWAANVTVGALANKINGSGLWEAKVVDSLGSAATGAGLFIDGAITADSDGVFNVLTDTSNAKLIAYRVSPDRGFKMGYKNVDEHRVSIAEIVTTLTCAGPTTNAFKIYECAPLWRGDGETLIYQKTPSNSAASTTTWASGNIKLTANDGNDLLLVISDAASITGSVTIASLFE